MFILDFDYLPVIRQDIRNIVTQNDSKTLSKAVGNAISYVQDHLRNTYDLDAIFISINAYSNSATYSEGDYVHSNWEIYKAKVDSPGALTNNDDWEKGDPRNQRLVEVIVDIAVYNMHSRLTPSNIPQIRIERYESATSWCEMVLKNQLNPGLPKLTANESGIYLFGSNDKVSGKW